MPNKLILLVLLPIISTGCTTHKLLNVADGSTKGKNTMLVNEIVRGVFTENDLIVLCLNGIDDISINEDEYYTRAFKKNVDSSSFNNFKITYDIGVERVEKGFTLSADNWNYTKTKTYKDCDNMPQGKEIKLEKDLFKNDTFSRGGLHAQYEYINTKYNNEIVITHYSSDYKSYGLLFLTTGDDVQHKIIVLRDRYFVDKGKCIICYAGLPFTLVIDIITSPFQLVWLGLQFSGGH